MPISERKISFSSFGACNQHSDNGQAQFAQEYEQYGGDMLVLGLENDTAPTESGVVYLDAIDDNFNIQFANLISFGNSSSSVIGFSRYPSLSSRTPS